MPEPGELGKLYRSYWEEHDSVFPRVGQGSQGFAEGSLFETATLGALEAMGYSDPAVSPAAHLFARILPFVPPLMEILDGTVMSLRPKNRGRLLDVGCGDGSFLVLMRSLGWQVAGIEPSPAAAKVARERHGLDVSVGNIEEVVLPEAAYDAVTMQHVIEHVHEPISVLKATHAALKPDGVLSIRTPNLDSLGHKRFRDMWMHMDPPRHLRLFVPSTLSPCVERSGFTILDVHTSPRSAQGVFDVSNAIRKASGARSARAPASRSLRSRMFLLYEALFCAVGRDVGEEIVLLATNSERDSQGLEQNENRTVQ
jgi:SAM-dependent methyltransferase